jgi:outer membrane lipoprotein-sorting protein
MKRGTCILFFSLILCTGKAQPASELLNKLITENDKIYRISMTIVMNERVDGEINEKKADFKINYNPHKIYLKQDYPNEDMEILYVEGLNKNRAWVYPNAFPWVTLSLDPTGNTMRGKHHHSIFNSGFNYFVDVVEHLMIKYADEINKLAKNAGIEFVNGVKCHKIVFENPYFRFINYKIKPGEDLVSIAQKFYINEYMIIENNKNIKDYEDIEPGQIIKMPSDYAKKVSIFLDAGTYLPYLIKVFDDEGLFQEYYFKNVRVNPYFSSSVFDPDNPNYNF